MSDVYDRTCTYCTFDMLFGAVTRKRTNRFRGLVDKDFIPDHGIRGPGMS